ncbi:GNAT family N-acetyltransferase [Kitasatospora sp. NBC_00374]|uniref:GNAT family N-acetyltransferase n=1 Tax=Kitasatospora sp. NBC_00374 TaxID=2975964 RepID=UPI0032518B34
MGNVARGRPGQEIEIRAVTAEELPDWDRAIARGFLRPHLEPGLDWRRLLFEPGRSLGAFDTSEGGDRCVATFRSFDSELTVPGGATLPVDAITSVTVTATHRRRGLLTAMMDHDLAAARERGSAAAILIAAEYNIYGRYGFGPATQAQGLRIDLTRSGGLRAGLPVPDGGRIDFVDMADLRKLGGDLHERWRRTQPGAISRYDAWWRLHTGDVTLPGFDWKEPFAALHRDADGQVTGLITYTVDDKWAGNLPDCTLTVLDHFALDQPTANALWQLAFSVDWVRTVLVESLGADDPLRLLLNDPRGAAPADETGDFTWLRLLDVPAAFAARTYAAPGRIVLDVTDPAGYAAGRWALETAADGTGRCVPTDDAPDLALAAARLAELYLGTGNATRLAAAALLTEVRPGAAAAADLLLRTPRQAWNPDGF